MASSRDTIVSGSGVQGFHLTDPDVNLIYFEQAYRERNVLCKTNLPLSR